MRVALLVSPDCFEGFYRDALGLDRATYVGDYRNDFVWNYTQGLGEHGIEVVTYMASTTYSGRDTAPDGFSVRFLSIPRWWYHARRGILRAVTPVERWALEGLNAGLLLPALRAGVAEDGIDVLYVQEYWTGRFDLLVRTAGLPVAAGEHGGSEGMHVHVGKSAGLRRAALITVQSTRERRRLQQRYGVSAKRITNGVDTRFFTPPDGGDRPTRILVVARLLDAQKRISDLISALAHLPEGWYLDVVGAGPDEAMLRKLCDARRVSGRVSFHGWEADRAALRERYRACGVFVLPSLWEAVTLAVLEAMACGAPVVVTPLRPFEDLISDGRNGILTPACNPTALAQAILTAYENRTSLGAAARSTVVERYDRHDTMRQLATALRDAPA